MTGRLRRWTSILHIRGRHRIGFKVRPCSRCVCRLLDACSQSGNFPRRASGWPVGPSLLLCCCCFRWASTAEPRAKRPRSPQPLRDKLLTAPWPKRTQKNGDWTLSGGAWSRSAATLTRSWSWWVGVMECVNTTVATVGLFWLDNTFLWTLHRLIWTSLLENERLSFSISQRTWIPSDNAIFSYLLSQSSQSTFRVPGPGQHHIWLKCGLWVLVCGNVAISDVLFRYPQDNLPFLAQATRCRSLTDVGRTSLVCLFQRGCDETQAKKKKKSFFFSFHLCSRWSVIGQMDMGIPAMTKCCNQLDMCYDTCGSNKYRCDSKFRWCLHSICSDLKKSLGFVSKVEGRFDFNLFLVDISQKNNE